MTHAVISLHPLKPGGWGEGMEKRMGTNVAF